MPGIDGIEATRRIRAAEAESGARTPIIALTANAFDEDREACLAAGMDGFLTKPLDRERLAGTLAERRPPRWRRRLSFSLGPCRGPLNAGSSAVALPCHKGWHACAAERELTTGAAPLPRPGGFRPFSGSDRRAGRVGRMFSCRLSRLMRSQIDVAVAIASVVRQLARSGGNRISDRAKAVPRNVKKPVDVPATTARPRRHRDRPRNRRSRTRTESALPSLGRRPVCSTLRPSTIRMSGRSISIHWFGMTS